MSLRAKFNIIRRGLFYPEEVRPGNSLRNEVINSLVEVRQEFEELTERVEQLGESQKLRVGEIKTYINCQREIAGDDWGLLDEINLKHRACQELQTLINQNEHVEHLHEQNVEV